MRAFSSNMGAGVTSALGFAVDAVGLAAAGGALCSMGSVIAVGLGGAMLAGQVAKGREADFETQLKKARKRLEDALRLNARFSGLNQDALSGMFETLPGAVTALALTPQDFINWNLDASRIAREIAGKLAVSSPYFAQNSDALDAAQTLLREAFGVVIETESFTTDTTHLYRKAVLERLDTISETQASSDAKLDEVLALMKGRINTDGVSTVALQKIIEKLGADEGLDPPEMLSWLESWVEDYRAMTTRGVNEDAAFRNALERAKQRFDLGDMNASQALMDELAREEEDEKRRVEERKRRRISLLEEAIRLDKLALNADAAVQKYVMIAKEQGLEGKALNDFLALKSESYIQSGIDSLNVLPQQIAICLATFLCDQTHDEVDSFMQADAYFRRARALNEIATIQSNLLMLKESRINFETSLQMFNDINALKQWRYCMTGYCNILKKIGVFENELSLIDRTIELLQAVISLLKVEKEPDILALACNNLSAAYLSKFGMTKNIRDAEIGIQQSKKGLANISKWEFPEIWALMNVNIAGLSLAWVVVEDDIAEERIRSGIACAKDALVILTPETNLTYWVNASQTLSRLYSSLASVCDDESYFEKSKDVLEEALKHVTPTQAPSTWANLQFSLSFASLGGFTDEDTVEDIDIETLLSITDRLKIVADFYKDTGQIEALKPIDTIFQALYDMKADAQPSSNKDDYLKILRPYLGTPNPYP